MMMASGDGNQVAEIRARYFAELVKRRPKIRLLADLEEQLRAKKKKGVATKARAEKKRAKSTRAAKGLTSIEATKPNVPRKSMNASDQGGRRSPFVSGGLPSLGKKR